jgi:hypothetical protein
VRFGDDLDVSPWKIAAVMLVGVAIWLAVICNIPGV